MTIADSRTMARLTLACIFLVSSCLLALTTITLCYALEWHGPFRDLWEFLATIRQQLDDQWSLTALIEPYGGIHRMLFPKLLFYLDYRFASGSNLLALSITLALHISGCYLLLRTIIADRNIDRADMLLITAMVIACFFSTTQIYNLIYISDNQVPLSNAFAIMAGYCFVVALHQNRYRLIYLANIFILIAAMCHSSGLMIWPAMILMLWADKRPLHLILIQLGLAGGVFALYLSGNDPLDTQQRSLIESAVDVLYSIMANSAGILRYIGLHLSSPVSREWPITGIFLGYLSISYLIWQIWRIRRQTVNRDALTRLALHLAIYGCMIGIVTALGRQIYPNSAMTDRYQTLVMTYWAALFCLLYLDLRKQSANKALLAPMLASVLLLPWQYQSAEQMQWLSSRVRIAHTAATAGITDIDSIAATLSHPLLMDNKNLVAEQNEWLRANKLGYFSEPLAEYFDNTKPVRFSSDLMAADCSGNILMTEPAGRSENAYKITGTGQINGKPISEILILDTDNQVAGLGHTHRERGNFIPQRMRDSASTTWIGFMKTTMPPGSTYVVVGRINNEFCRLFETRL